MLRETVELTCQATLQLHESGGQVGLLAPLVSWRESSYTAHKAARRSILIMRTIH